LILLAIAVAVGFLLYHFFASRSLAATPKLPLIGKQVAQKSRIRIPPAGTATARATGPYSDAKPPAPFSASAERKNSLAPAVTVRAYCL